MTIRTAAHSLYLQVQLHSLWYLLEDVLLAKPPYMALDMNLGMINYLTKHLLAVEASSALHQQIRHLS